MDTTRIKVAIIGGGTIGLALEHILKKNLSVAISVYDSNPEKTRDTVQETVAEADILFLCVPSWAIRKAVLELKPHLKKETFIVSLAKGIEKESMKTMDALFAELLPEQSIGILGGPMLAAEFMKNLPSTGCLATKQPELARKISEIFSGTILSIETTLDTRGVALAGVLKNIYALGLGISNGLSLGNNEKGLFVARALAEMAQIIMLLGGKRETAYSLAGIGDLIATGLSSHSKNSRAGAEIALTGTCNHQSEGCASLPYMAEILKNSKIEIPIFRALEAIILRHENAKTEFAKLIIRQ